MNKMLILKKFIKLTVEVQLESLGRVPTGIVERHDHDFVRSRADVLCKPVEHGLEHVGVDATGQPPVDGAGSRVHESMEIEPVISVCTVRSRPLADLGPDAPDDWFQAQPVLIEGPDLDRSVQRLALGGFDFGCQFFLKSSRSSAEAALVWQGLGRCKLKPSRCK